jgi:hypothetical protein
MAKMQTAVLLFGFHWRRFMVLPLVPIINPALPSKARAGQRTQPQASANLRRFPLSSQASAKQRATLKKNTKLFVDLLRKPSY